LIATSRRGALIALVVSVLAYILATRQDLPSLRRVFRLPSLLIVTGAIFILAGSVIDPLRPLSDAFRITSDPGYGLGGRLDQSLVLWRDFLENPVSGLGWMGNSLSGKTFWAASNYIFILADLGLIGFSLLLMLMASTLHQCWRNMKCLPKGSAVRGTNLFAFVSFVGIYAAMVSDIILVGGQPTLLLLGICLGVTARSAVWQE
jgi:O-antigen ligase